MHLSDLRPLYELSGPWVSVYLDASRDRERGAEAVGLRWRAVREALSGAGVRPEVLSEMEQVVTSDDHEGRHGLAILAGPRGVAHVEMLPRPPATGSAEVSPVPHVMPMLEQRGEQVPWLRVVIDRTGGDIEQAVVGRAHKMTTVEGSEVYPMTKRKPGGWSAPRYQSEVEVTWQRNAGDVVSQATALAEEADAEVLIVAGDVRARQLMLERMPRRWRERVVEVEGSRAHGADPQRLDEQTRREVARVAHKRIEDALNHFHAQSAHETAAAGLPSVVTALQRGTAGAVLVEPSKLDDVPLWVGPEPAQLATTETELTRLGISAPERVHAGDALARATAGTGAELFLVEQEEAAALDDGVAVLLRSNP
jgi:hypothetical protein